MLNLYNAALISSKAYDIDLSPPSGWQLLDTSKNTLSKNLGYRGIAYVNQASKDVVIAHRGTEINAADSCASTAYYNLYSDIDIMYQGLPTETTLALHYAQSIAVQYPNYTITQVGHSLGGFHANVCGYILQHNVIAFDSPGSHENLTKIQKQLNENQLVKHYNFLAESNLINAVNTQIGNVYRRRNADDNDSNIYAQSSYHWISATKTAHGIQTFVDSIPENSPHPSVSIPSGYILLTNALENDDTSSYHYGKCILL